ncbi:dNTPase inhibitor [Escherichia phage vB_Ec_Tarrare]|uniref:DNTPase inhibitor n=1 Tax=Escherichia phage vB_Ec_Tarrare TaxID=3032379 RepID=A0AAF0ICP0_9CAUD|nr:dNTPase inhibitor [Escherichia phage vB_Ec_Tarrare]
MGRLYSGNLNAFKGACNRLYQMDFAVIVNEFHDAMYRQECMKVRIEDRAGNIIIQDTFCHYDVDVLYNTATAWLNGMADQLQHWK